MGRTVEVPEYELHDRVRVDPVRTALLVIDMQNDFVSEGGALRVPDAQATVSPIRTLIGRAREHGVRVLFTQDTHEDGDPEWEIWPEHARLGSWGWEVVSALAPTAGDTVIRKVRYDAFYATAMEHLLRLWRIDTVVMRHGRQHLRARVS